ncbi:MAG TPA: orotidine 5'-phosphate decarboxylase / HUMPS family protein [Candidatus Paceibacterota bacterium]|nr:orotidine 5'-phosphate decarboxylase / HUMPS family protein [Candidatus Paceibacterota bacterium]
MIGKKTSKLDSKKRYLQIALNSTLKEAGSIISQLPVSDRILVEAGTPFIKRYGVEGIKQLKKLYTLRIAGEKIHGQLEEFPVQGFGGLSVFFSKLAELNRQSQPASQKLQFKLPFNPYVVADLKMMDRGATEVEIAQDGGADAAVALGHAPIESLDAFIAHCSDVGLDSMIDMMNVEFPLSVLRKLKSPPNVVLLHRGVDEEHYNRQKQLPLHEIRRIKSNYDTLIAIAGGDTHREVQSAIFNDADIVVVWKSFFHSTQHTAQLAEEFLREIK